MQKAIFLDRDGVINIGPPKGTYVTKWAEFEFEPGAKEAIKRISDSEYKAIVITNQAGVARGLYTIGDLEDIHKKMTDKINASGGSLDGIYYCPHIWDSCDCRKPLPGMLDQANRDFGIDFNNSWMIGDSESDIGVGISRNCKTIMISNEDKETQADFTSPSLIEALSFIPL